MKKFLILVSSLSISSISMSMNWLPPSDNLYYYSQMSHPESLNYSENSTFYHSQKNYPLIFLNNQNESYYFSQLNNEDKNKILKLSYTKAQKKLEINKELLEKDIDWNKILEINKEIGNIEAEINLIYQRCLNK
jgi:hypothetical protein